MTNRTISLFENPKTEEVFLELFDRLLEESERGAVLIGTSYVETQLGQLVECVFPKNSKIYKDKLLKYPGALSSFSAKIELSYAFRLITENIYNSLNALRKIRNDAAHSSENFSLRDIEDSFNEIFNFGEGFRTMIHNTSAKMMVSSKLETVKKKLIDNNNTEEKAIELILERLQDKEVLEGFENQLPRWKLVYGLTILCGLLQHYIDETILSVKGINTWSQVADKLSK